MKKRIVSWILLLTFLLIQVPINVFAADGALPRGQRGKAQGAAEEAAPAGEALAQCAVGRA